MTDRVDDGAALVFRVVIAAMDQIFQCDRDCIEVFDLASYNEKFFLCEFTGL